MGAGFPFGVMLWHKRGSLHNMAHVLNATEVNTLLFSILCKFHTKIEKEKKQNGQSGWRGIGNHESERLSFKVRITNMGAPGWLRWLSV